MTFSFCYDDCDSAHIEERKEALKSLVEERNEFIHHLLPRLNSMSMDSWNELEQYLDLQRERVLPVLTQLQSEMRAIREGRKEMAEFINSEVDKKLYDFLFRPEGHLVTILYNEAVRATQNDGWIPLHSVGQLIRKIVNEEKESSIKECGYKTLKSLILATDLFDISEEPVAQGGARVSYRLKQM